MRDMSRICLLPGDEERSSASSRGLTRGMAGWKIPEAISLEEAVSQFDVSRATLRRRLAAGQIPGPAVLLWPGTEALGRSGKGHLRRL
jgi:hypothetical protein